MITIGVVSDTHIPARSSRLPEELLYGLEKVDMIIHCGDLIEMSVVEELEKIAPVHAVFGNMDGPDVRRLLPEKKVIEVSGKRIGITHGAGAPFGIKKRVVSAFRDDNVHCITFGHTHHAEKDKDGDILLFNPGSSTDTLFARAQSFGLLFIDDTAEISAEIITF